ncbi:MAG: hypothetical protein O7D34_01000 [Ignavibacteria bacterium]|nr:hypothetical protein [Ignavibacteria bacterium]
MIIMLIGSDTMVVNYGICLFKEPTRDNGRMGIGKHNPIALVIHLLRKLIKTSFLSDKLTE